MENGWPYQQFLMRKILKDFHTGHPGIIRMKALMRSYIYWPTKDKDIENMLKSYKSCAFYSKSTSHKIQSMVSDRKTIVSSTF